MRIALLADVHANLEALAACLAHARERGADAHAFLGDLVGYGPDPAAVVELVREHAGRGAVVVRGNHDATVVDGRADTTNLAAEAAIDWTRARLDPGALAFLAGLPLLARRGDAVFVHASAASPAGWTYVTSPRDAEESLDAASARWVFCGHVHAAALFHATGRGPPVAFRPVPGIAVPVPARRRWLAIVGAVGQPRDGNPDAAYAIADLDRQAITFHRVAYDWAATAAKIRAAGLPERLAARLERGE